MYDLLGSAIASTQLWSLRVINKEEAYASNKDLFRLAKKHSFTSCICQFDAVEFQKAIYYAYHIPIARIDLQLLNLCRPEEKLFSLSRFRRRTSQHLEN